MQGTSTIYEDALAIESHAEVERKAAVLREPWGPKLFALTLNEFSLEEPAGMSGYGTLDDYDYVVILQIKRPVGNQQFGLRHLSDSTSPLEVEISGWHYQILSHRLVPAPSGLNTNW